MRSLSGYVWYHILMLAWQRDYFQRLILQMMLELYEKSIRSGIENWCKSQPHYFSSYVLWGNSEWNLQKSVVNFSLKVSKARLNLWFFLIEQWGKRFRTPRHQLNSYSAVLTFCTQENNKQHSSITNLFLCLSKSEYPILEFLQVWCWDLPPIRHMLWC